MSAAENPDVWTINYNLKYAEGTEQAFLIKMDSKTLDIVHELYPGVIGCPQPSPVEVFVGSRVFLIDEGLRMLRCRVTTLRLPLDGFCIRHVEAFLAGLDILNQIAFPALDHRLGCLN